MGGCMLFVRKRGREEHLCNMIATLKVTAEVKEANRFDAIVSCSAARVH